MNPNHFFVVCWSLLLFLQSNFNLLRLILIKKEVLDKMNFRRSYLFTTVCLTLITIIFINQVASDADANAEAEAEADREGKLLAGRINLRWLRKPSTSGKIGSFSSSSSRRTFKFNTKGRIEPKPATRPPRIDIDPSKRNNPDIPYPSNNNRRIDNDKVDIPRSNMQNDSGWEKAGVIFTGADVLLTASELSGSLVQSALSSNDDAKTLSNSPTLSGRFIRLQYGGCLDASGTSFECTCGKKTKAPCEWTFAQRNLNMPLHASETRWHFDGPFLITYLNNDVNLKRCLKFQTPVDFMTNTMEIVVSECSKGLPSERWFIKTHPEQLQASFADPLFPKPYFSIHSEAHPEMCLTVRPRTKLMPGGFGKDPVVIPGRSVHDHWSKITFYGFYLERCTACPLQTFYLEENYFGQLFKMQNSTSFHLKLLEMAKDAGEGKVQKECPEDELYHPEKEISNDVNCQCMSPCSNQSGKYKYNWCYTSCKNGASNKWKYCSGYNSEGISSELDYKGRPCKKSHPCGYHGYTYEWCYLKDGGWGYCSKDYDHVNGTIVNMDHYEVYAGEQICSERETYEKKMEEKLQEEIKEGNVYYER